MAIEIEIVDFPIKHLVISHSYVYKRLPEVISIPLNPIKSH